MRQTILCVPLEVKPESAPQLARLVQDLRREFDPDDEGPLGNFTAIQEGIPAAHFLSICVFPPHPSYDPLLVLEANIDGATGPFWAQFERTVGAERLRAMLRCCKSPRDGTKELFQAVTAAGARTPIAPFFERRTRFPSAAHMGNRGLSRDRIREEECVAREVEKELDNDPRYRAMQPAAVHAAMRGRLLACFPSLAAPEPSRIGRWEGLLDVLRLALFVAVVLAVLLLPGALLHAALGWQLYLAVIAVATTFAALGLRAEGGWEGVRPVASPVEPPPPAAPGHRPVRKPRDHVWTAAVLGVLGAPLVLFVLPALGFLALALIGQGGATAFGALFHAVLVASLWGIGGLVPIVFGFAWLLRFHERRDPPLDAPPLDSKTLAEIVRREDRVTQNHMASLVVVRPGVLRAVVIRLGHLGLHLALKLRPDARDGFLGSMRTVHFAHWAFLDNGSRLIFLSNFDHSWASYLDDFIEKSHIGLTLAWGCSIGFPRTAWLVREGATDGRRFKAYALASRTASSFWYSAYPMLTVERIERHFRIAEGLRRPHLSEGEAREWLRLL